MQAAQSSAGVWGDAGSALVWGILTLGGLGSEVTVVKTESGHQGLPLLFPGGITVTASAAPLGSRGLVLTPAPVCIGAGRR